MTSALTYRVLAVLLCAGLLLRGLFCGNLLCLYCPLRTTDKPCYPVRSKCPPEELCFTSKAYYAGYAALTASGCTTKQQCAARHPVFYKGTNFTMTYACCERNLCNSAPSFSTLGSARLVAPVAAAGFLLARRSY